MKGGSSYYTDYTRDLSGSGGESSSEDPCDNLDFKSQIIDLQPSISKYSIGDALDVAVNPSGSIVVIGEHGICGTISGMKVIKLKKCIAKGKEYLAVIVDKGSSHCEVRIKPLI